jgi:hypothetical protein
LLAGLFAFIVPVTMSARDIIRQIEALPPEEQQEVITFVRAKEAELQAGSVEPHMSFQDAKKHVFTEYRDVLEELAK